MVSRLWGVADEQAQPLHAVQVPGHGFEAGEEEVADGELGGVLGGQDPVDVIRQLRLAVVYDVVRHRFSFLSTVPEAAAP
ncbi:MAG: hypothetical protein WCL11_20015 [Verrucomicrobiota bacterium]